MTGRREAVSFGGTDTSGRYAVSYPAFSKITRCCPAGTSKNENSPPPGAERVTTISGVKEKLKLLKDLFDEGLITEEEYAKKKAELLEDL